MKVSKRPKSEQGDIRLNSLMMGCAILTVLLGMIVLGGWVLGLKNMNSFGNKFIPMAEETAISFLITGGALLFFARNRNNSVSSLYLKVSSLALALFALLALVDFGTGYVWHLGDLIGPSNQTMDGILTGRMSFTTAFCFLALSIAIFLLTSKAKKYSPIFSIAVLFTGYTISVGYSYGVPYLYNGATIPMAWPTAIAFMASSFGILLAVGKEQIPVCYFVGAATRAKMLRSLIPMIFLIMIAQNYLEAYNNKNVSQSSALLYSLIDIVSLFAAGTVISILSRSIGNSIDQNIAKRIQAERELQRSEYELKKAQQITHIGSFKIELATNTVSWTEELYKMYGFDPAFPPPKLDDSQKLFEPESWTLLSNSIKQAVQTGIPYQIELKTIRRDHSNGWMWARGEAIKDASGTITEIWGAVQDITDRKRIEEDLRLAMEKAEESDRLKSAFLANMSHEIRTPMNGILGFAELLKEPNLSGDEQQQYVAIIEKSGARMLNIINDIIDISKIESGLMTVDLKMTNVNDQMEYICSFFQPEIERKGMNLLFRKSLPKEKVNIVTDREKLFAILTNLVKNAIKYSERGTIEFGYELVETHSSVETHDRTSLLQFYVKDQGIGIPKERQIAIFERFIQADIEDLKSRQGAGLGLTITKSYIEMLGGKIWVESEEGVGSTFFFTLPIHEGADQKNDINKAIELSEKEDKLSQLKILIVEDDEISEKLIKKMVEKISEKTLFTSSGIDAIEICRKNRVDLVLLDLGLPDLNGCEVAKQIRQFNKEVVIIAQTAYGFAGDKENAFATGCNDYVSKPINSSELRSKIILHCNKKKGV